MLSFFRFIPVGVWFLFSSMLATIWCIIRWGNLNNNKQGANFICRPILWLVGWDLRIEGSEYLNAREPRIYVMNHQSNMDAFICGAFFPERTFIIGKRSIVWIPFFGAAFLAGGNVPLNRKNRSAAIHALSNAVAKLQERNASIFIFPEGTRNRTENLLQPFKKGAFHMALEAKVPVVPIVCQPVRSLFDPRNRVLKKGLLRVRVLPPVFSEGPEADVESLSGRVHAQMVEAIRGLATQ